MARQRIIAYSPKQAGQVIAMSLRLVSKKIPLAARIAKAQIIMNLGVEGIGELITPLAKRREAKRRHLASVRGGIFILERI